MRRERRAPPRDRARAVRLVVGVRRREARRAVVGVGADARCGEREDRRSAGVRGGCYCAAQAVRKRDASRRLGQRRQQRSKRVRTELAPTSLRRV